MNTLKSLIVIGVLAIIGYGLYVHMNSAPPSATPDYIKKQAIPETLPAVVEMGREGSATAAAPSSVVTFGPQGGSSAPPLAVPTVSPPPLVSGPPTESAGAATPYPYTTAGMAQPYTAGGPAATGSPPPAAGMAPPYASAGTSAAMPLPAAAPYPITGAARPYTADAAMPSGGATPVPVPMSPESAPRGAAPSGFAATPSQLDRYGGAAAATPPLAPPAASLPPASGGPMPPTRTPVSPTAATATVDPANSVGSPDYDRMMVTAQNQLDGGHWETALLTLTQLYEDPQLNRRQQEQLEGLLDRVAGTVIYSKKFLFEPPHRVMPGENLADVAKKYNIPPELIAKINGLKPNQSLERNQELKVLQGPFQAVVNPQRHLLILKVGGRYAGRFPVGMGPEFAEIDGQYIVSSKIRQNFRVDGQRYMELQPTAAVSSIQKLAIVGMADPNNAERGQARGTIAVNPRYADDVYDILSQGSPVTIRR